MTQVEEDLPVEQDVNDKPEDDQQKTLKEALEKEIKQKEEEQRVKMEQRAKVQAEMERKQKEEQERIQSEEAQRQAAKNSQGDEVLREDQREPEKEPDEEGAAIKKESVAEEEKKVEEPESRTFTHRGKTYRKRLNPSNGVNTNHSLEDVHQYVGEWPPERCGEKRRVQDEIPYRSIDDYVNTMRQSCGVPGEAFLWPSERVGFQRAIAVALQQLPTGHMISVKNAQKIPKKFYHKKDELD